MWPHRHFSKGKTRQERDGDTFPGWWCGSDTLGGLVPVAVV